MFGATDSMRVSETHSYTSPQLCKAANSSMVVCVSPVWPYEAGHDVPVSLSRVVSGRPLVSVPGSPPILFYADTSRFCPTVTGAWSGARVLIPGSGFLLAPQTYFCLWKGQSTPCSPPAFLTVEAQVVNASMIMCQLDCHSSERNETCMQTCLGPTSNDSASCNGTICQGYPDQCHRRCVVYSSQSRHDHMECLNYCLACNRTCSVTSSQQECMGECLASIASCPTTPINGSEANASEVKRSAREFQCASQCSVSVPFWPYPAMNTTLFLQARGAGKYEIETVQQTQFNFLAEAKRIVPTSSGCGRGHVITVIGAGFDPQRQHPTYFCSVVGNGFDGSGSLLVLESALARATDTGYVECKMPARMISTRANVTLMQLLPDAHATGNREDAVAIPLARHCIQQCADGNMASDNTTTLPYNYYPQILSIEPTTAFAIYGTPVNVTGAGFAPWETYTIRFSRLANGKLLHKDSPVVKYISADRLEAFAPVWNSDWGAGVVNVTLLWPEKEALQGHLQFDYAETVSAIVYCAGKASGDFVDLAGYALIRDDPVYHCTISAAANHSRMIRGRSISTKHSTSILCDFPAWPHAAEPIHVRVWREGKPVAENPLLARSPGPLACDLNPVWWGQSIPRYLSFNGGESIAINGFGLSPHPSPPQDIQSVPCSSQDKWLNNVGEMVSGDYRELDFLFECGDWIPNYECRFTEIVPGDVAVEYTVSTGGVATNSSWMLCTTPLWLAERRESQLSIYACHISANAPSTSGVVPGSPIRTRQMFASPQDRMLFDKHNRFGIAGLTCETIIPQVGPWNGEIVFTKQPTISHPGTTPNAPIRGNPTITLSGANFGYKDASPVVRVIDSGCQFTRWISESTILCGVAAMGPFPYQQHPAHSSGDLVVTIALYRSNSRTEAFTYDGPMFFDVARNLHSQTSPHVVDTRLQSLMGKDFAVADVTVRARTGGTGCEQTMWTSSSMIICRNAAGQRSTHPVVLSVHYSQHLDTVSDAFSFDVMSVSGYAGINRHGTGASSLTIHGTAFGQFGVTPSARAGDSACQSSLWHSDTTITALAARGTVASRRVLLTANDVASSVSFALSVDKVSMSELLSGNRPGTGSLSVTVVGVGFGSLQYSARIRSASTHMDFSIWTSDTAVRCSIVSGIRATRRVFMTVGLDVGGSLTNAFSYLSVPIRSAAARVDLGVRTPPAVLVGARPCNTSSLGDGTWSCHEEIAGGFDDDARLPTGLSAYQVCCLTADLQPRW